MSKTAAAGAGAIESLRFTMPILKVDKEKRQITGTATAEIVDAHDEVVDYATAKSAFEKWKGNIREMHQPVAVGKSVGVEFDDANKQIVVTSYISKGAQDTWEKILDGTLKDYSIGARGVRKAEKIGDQSINRIFLTSMGELSVVDSGALPGSAFEIVKMDGEQPIAAQPAEPTDEAAAADAPAADVPVVAEKPVVKVLELRGLASRAVAVALLPVAKGEATLSLDGLDAAIVKRCEGYDVSVALQTMQYLEQLLSSEMCEAMYSEDVDPEGPAQIEMLKAAGELILSFIISEFMGQFDEPADSGGDASAPAAEVAMRKAAAVIKASQADRLITFSAINEAGKVLFFTKAGARHSKNDSEMIQKMHDTSIALGANCSSDNKAETSDADGDNEGEAEKAAALTAAPATTGSETASEAASLTPAGSAPAVAAASADEPTGTASPAQVEKKATPEELAHAELLAKIGGSEAVAKLEAILKGQEDVIKGAQATIAAQAGTIAGLETRILKLEDQPLPGGPISRAAGQPMTRVMGTPVEKGIGNRAPASVDADGIEPAVMIKALQQLATNASSEEERERIAEKILDVQFASGLGGKTVQFTRGGE